MLAINKIDLVGYDAARFEEIRATFAAFAERFGFETLEAIPISARYGDNVTTRSTNTGWYSGPTLIEHLESVDVSSDAAAKPFRMPVQWVNRPNLDFRGFSGTIASGTVRTGDPIVSAASGRTSIVKRIVTMDGDLDVAYAGEAVTLTLADEIDLSRGDVIAARRPARGVGSVRRPCGVDERRAAVAGPALSPEERHPHGHRQVTEIKYKVDVNTFDHLAAKSLDLNEVGFCNLSLSTPIAFDAYADNRETGAFILIDRLSNATVAAGMISFGCAGRRTSTVRRSR